jgi:hypothetical protein
VPTSKFDGHVPRHLYQTLGRPERLVHENERYACPGSSLSLNEHEKRNSGVDCRGSKP